MKLEEFLQKFHTLLNPVNILPVAIYAQGVFHLNTWKMKNKYICQQIERATIDLKRLSSFFAGLFSKRTKSTPANMVEHHWMRLVESSTLVLRSQQETQLVRFCSKTVLIGFNRVFVQQLSTSGN